MREKGWEELTFVSQPANRGIRVAQKERKNPI
jgi:hypothetical protein